MIGPNKIFEYDTKCGQSHPFYESGPYTPLRYSLHAHHSPRCREETQALLEDHTDSTDKKPTPTIKARGLLLYGNTPPSSVLPSGNAALARSSSAEAQVRLKTGNGV